MVRPKKKAKQRAFGTVNYDTKKQVLKASADDNNRRLTFQLGLEFSKLSITSRGENAVDLATSSWVSKLRTSVKHWRHCIDTCWKDRGGQDGFLAMKGSLAYGKYKCRCPKK